MRIIVLSMRNHVESDRHRSVPWPVRTVLNLCRARTVALIGLLLLPAAPFGSDRANSQSPNRATAGEQFRETAPQRNPQFVSRRDDFVGGLNAEPDMSSRIYQAVERGLSTIPHQIRDRLKNAGIMVVITPTMLSAVPEWNGATPRGWDPESNYDNLGGVFHKASKRVLIAEKIQSLKDSSVYTENNHVIRTLRHELGHAYDHLQGFYSQGEDFTLAYTHDADRISANDRAKIAYFLQPGVAGRAESFATMFASIYTPESESGPEATSI